MAPFIQRALIVADRLGNAVVVGGLESTHKRTSYYALSIGIVEIIVSVATLFFSVRIFTKSDKEFGPMAHTA